jgi:hypothetical protein
MDLLSSLNGPDLPEEPAVGDAYDVWAQVVLGRAAPDYLHAVGVGRWVYGRLGLEIARALREAYGLGVAGKPVGVVEEGE